MGSEFTELFEVLLERLEQSGLDDDAQLLVLAAVEGDGEFAETLAEALAGAVEPGRRAERPAAPEVERESAYLKAVTVRGFRGIGPEASLRLQPSPGLTLVLGRNGSGKSSFAEAVEVVLTGTSYRWKERSGIWKTGWRNLHTDDPTAVTVELMVDGDRGKTTVTRTWVGSGAEDSRAWMQRPGRPRAPLEELGWAGDLTTYRPFLSYYELSGMLEGRPSDMYDALASILGLDHLADAEKRLGGARRSLEKEVKDLRDELRPLVEGLSALDDPRAQDAAQAVRRQPPDLDRAAALASGNVQEEPSGELASLRRTIQLARPDEDGVAAAVQDLRAAADRVASYRGTDAEDARRLADLLAQALDHHDRHADDATCPVCGTGDVLDAEWAARTRAEIDRLRHTAAEAEAAYGHARRAIRNGHALITRPPALLPEGSAVAEAWAAWEAGTRIDDAFALADHLERETPRLTEAVGQARKAATQRLGELEDRWQPIALRLAGWVGQAREVEVRADVRAAVKAGYDWLRMAADDLRNDRLQPIAEHAAAVWSELRQESNVELGPIKLTGSATRRRVQLDVTVDGEDGTALGVMSQGELHALALALFLPRATSTQSPFRFLVIDDPVQSMDPAKVDGLARVLSRTAEQRQVVVFTHDGRLADAVSRLRLPATICEVVRREGSLVEVKKRDDAVARLLDDAHALIKTEDLPPPVAPRVVPGFCRSALESALLERVRRERLAAGVRHADVEDEIARASGPYELAALAFFGDTRRGGDVLRHINRTYGGRMGDTFRECSRAGHKAYGGSLDELRRDTQRLTEQIRHGR